MSYLFSGFGEKERIPYLEKEITRLQELCRTNFGVIAELKKENRKLKEIHEELKDTTSDLAYSLADCPWWGEHDPTRTLSAFRVLITYAKNIQYILQLPIFFDPMEQLESYGFNRDRALRYLKTRVSSGHKKGFKLRKCSQCKKIFTSEDRKKKHEEFHNRRKRLHCIQCGKYIDSFPAFKSHLQSHEFMNQMMAFPTRRFHQNLDTADNPHSSPGIESNCKLTTILRPEYTIQSSPPRLLNNDHRTIETSSTLTEDEDDVVILPCPPKKISELKSNNNGINLGDESLEYQPK